MWERKKPREKRLKFGSRSAILILRMSSIEEVPRQTLPGLLLGSSASPANIQVFILRL
jgi:hypothetical protein